MHIGVLINTPFFIAAITYNGILINFQRNLKNVRKVSPVMFNEGILKRRNEFLAFIAAKLI